MGDIYKAHDARLNRFVAVKVLSSANAGDPERRRRFIQEAQAASGLNHPNIITVHDIVNEPEGDYMVMEFVSGKTLIDLIPKGGLRAPQALKYGVQMADALSAAHAAGIVHRDLKPGNVMVTDSGLVKVLDFGLAKLTDRGPASNIGDNTQTIAEAPLTVEGSIIGTVSYMSPEQAQGKKVDTRSDIFSFGVVLYEMVTGARAFEGDSTLTTLSAILRDDVRPVAQFAPEAPPQLELVIRRCLKKSPDDRWQTMKDVQMALAALKHESDSGMLDRSRLTEAPAASSSVKAAGNKTKGVQKPVLAAALSGLVVLAAIGGAMGWRHHRATLAAQQAAIEAAAAAEAAARPVPAPPEPAPDDATAAAPITPPPPPADESMTNDHIIQMVEGKVSSSVIISQIRASKTSFVLTPSEVIRLSKAGVPDSVIEVMRNPKRAVTASVVPPAPTKATPKQEPPPPQQPVVVAQPQPVAIPAPAAPSPATVAKAPAPPPSQTSSPQPGNAKASASFSPAMVKDGTPFSIMLAEDIPDNAEEGRPLRFTVSRDVRVGENV